jgi:hypothetical protein
MQNPDAIRGGLIAPEAIAAATGCLPPISAGLFFHPWTALSLLLSLATFGIGFVFRGRAGGEVGPATAYMVEAAPLKRRGLYGSMQFLTQDVGTLLAALVGLTLSCTLSPQNLQDWGWRIAFLMGVIIVPFGLLMRNRLAETLDVADAGAQVPAMQASAPALRTPIGPYMPIIIYVLVLFSCSAIGAYVLDYMTTYALNTLLLPANVAFGVSVVTATTLMSQRCSASLFRQSSSH